ncbi:hypothetical protein N7457_007285 [Penicillium paradoxum]|uniref:uncharacterized protein n=1 Tax=Penicillium paradoxum TaxID=176176 RepID=UPI0025485EDA|nr:uncharacterized protein N7457_007285 [Penicillium paradoxum]KAJ5779565.1 hypothetical protein N7457_007285 [Penicillium paradoxum]
MDQTHTRALDALQPFIHLARSTSASSPRFVTNLITNATSSPQTYVFAELLELPNVQALRSPDTPTEFKGYLKLLEIFAWGTWQEYEGKKIYPAHLNHSDPKPFNSVPPDEPTSQNTITQANPTPRTSNPRAPHAEHRTNPQTPPPLSPHPLNNNQTPHLQRPDDRPQHPHKSRARIPRDNSHLRLPDHSPPLTSIQPPSVNVTAVAPLRDVQPQSLPNMIASLTEWESRCSDVASDLEAEIARIKSNAAKNAAREQAHNEAVADALSKKASAGAKKNTRRGGRLGSGIGGSKRDANDIDQDDGFFDHDGEGSRMEIDEGPGARAGNSRQPKRVLGRKS